MDGNIPLVSVLITSYNREKLIRFALESVLAQTFKDFEIIVSDNCSTDNTINIVKEYMHDPRIRLFVNEENIGQFPNRNKAASLAKGKYLKYLDSDDYMYPWGLEILVNTMEKFPGAGWGLCSLPQVVERPYPFELNCSQAYEHHYAGPGLFHKAPLSSIILKESFEKVGGFQVLPMVGDSEMWHRMALHFPVVLMPDGIVWYREHGDQELVAYRKYIIAYEQIEWDYLKSDKCPLTREKIASVIKAKKKKGYQVAACKYCNNETPKYNHEFQVIRVLSFQELATASL